MISHLVGNSYSINLCPHKIFEGFALGPCGKLTQNSKPRWLGQSTIIESEELTEQIFQSFKENIIGPFFPFQFLFVVPLSSQKIGQDHHHFIFSASSYLDHPTNGHGHLGVGNRLVQPPPRLHSSGPWREEVILVDASRNPAG